MNMRLLLLALTLLVAARGGAAEQWQPLYNRVDADLQKELEARVALHPEWARLVRAKKMAIGLVDLRSEPPRFARINGNQMMYAASLPKIAVTLAVYASFEDGTLEETDELHTDLVAMLRISSNRAATRLIDAVGMEKIKDVLTDPRYGLYDGKRGGGLWVGKRYASAGKRVGDPLFNISHGATATQVCRFFYLLHSGRLINEYRSLQMLADLSDPHLHHKFVAPIEARAPDAKIYRKSGTWKQWHADAVLVRGTRWRDYILVALVESPNGEAILRMLLPAVEEIIVPPDFADGFDDF